MKKPRSIFAGATNFMGASLADIREYIDDWIQALSETNVSLKAQSDIIEANKNKFDRSAEILSYIDFFIDCFERYIEDLTRLKSYLKLNVSSSNVEILQNVYDDSSSKEHICVNFARAHINRAVIDESYRVNLDRVYAISRDMVIDLKDVSNLVSALKTFVVNPDSAEDVIEIKPNFFGLGVNLNALLRKLWKR